MNRRNFIISSFMFGLLLAVGVKPKHEPERQLLDYVWIRCSTDPECSGYSYDDGKTWVKTPPIAGFRVGRYDNGMTVLYQNDPRHMPTWHGDGFSYAP